jgi:hypothetical protein
MLESSCLTTTKDPVHASWLVGLGHIAKQTQRQDLDTKKELDKFG